MGCVYCFIPLTLVSSVGRVWDCSEKKVTSQGLRFNPGTGDNYAFFIFIGKFAQRSNLIKTKVVTEPKEFFDYLYSSEFEVTDARLVNDETVEVHYRNVGEFAEQNNKVNIVIAAFTTAYARLKLYDLLDLLQERVLYYDTDSVIYVHESGKPEPPLGDYLGDLTDELDGDYITTFVSGGPKNYAYVTNNDKRVTKNTGHYTRPCSSW